MSAPTGALGLENRIYTGFPPIREIRDNFEQFFQSGKSGKNKGFWPSIRGKNSNYGKIFLAITFRHKIAKLRDLWKIKFLP